MQLVLAAAAVLGAACSVGAPRSGILLSAAATGTAWCLGVTSDPFAITGVALFTAAEHRGSRRFPRPLIVSALTLFLLTLLLGAEDFEHHVRNGLLCIGVLSVSWALGVRSRQIRSETSVRSRTEERLRVARDVHDVLSHSLGTIGMRAGVAAHVAALDEAELRTTLREIEESARTGMHELRALLRRERLTDPAGRHGPEGGPGSSESLSRTLSEVARTAERAGVPTSLDLSEAPEDLPPAVQAAVHRIVQEAATNVVRHSAASSATIEVAGGDGWVEVSVSDNGRGRKALLHEGHGLTGIRERAALLGGSVVIEEHEDGGLLVLVRLPAAGARREEHAR